MASVTSQAAEQPAPSRRRRKRRSTSHLKLVPETKELREQMRGKCYEVAARLDKSHALSKDQMEQIARATLEEMGLPEGYVGWTMVMLGNAFWEDQVAAVPYERRLFLLPHCLKHAEGCPADYDEFGLDCRQCGACSIADFRTEAEDKGYKVLVAEGSPIVLKIIVSGYIDAIVGVACLNVLEKAIDKILLAGIPCMAVPLLSSDCRNTSVDEDWVSSMIRVEKQAPQVQTSTYVHLMRSASQMFNDDELPRLAPRLRGKTSLPELNGHGVNGLDPIAGTEAIAYDFLAKGGKHSRPFITLAVHDAMTGGKATQGNGAAAVAEIPDAVKRTALAIETFHKASLVHDDIEDDDQFRYGEETLHRQYGTPTAINIGDYLIGLGYRLVSRESGSLGAETANAILDRLADAHMKLSEGQGAELLWRDSLSKQLTPLDALKIYALKTSPAFEAALYSGMRLAGPIDDDTQTWITGFSRNLGVAFQILNDLNDFTGDDHNKMQAFGDLVGGRPTVIWALALEGLDEAGQQELQELVARPELDPAAIARIRHLMQEAGAFDKASRLVDKHHERAEAIADEVEPLPLRRLLYYLVDTVLDRQPASEPTIVAEPATFAPSLPIASKP